MQGGVHKPCDILRWLGSGTCKTDYNIPYGEGKMQQEKSFIKGNNFHCTVPIVSKLLINQSIFIVCPQKIMLTYLFRFLWCVTTQ